MTIQGLIVDSFSKNQFRRIRLDDGTTAIGFSASEPGVGMQVQLFGDWETHPTFGRQFKFTTFVTRSFSAGPEAMTRWLTLFDGIGPRKARDIVDLFGKETYDIIRENPEQLLRVPGISVKTVEKIKEDFEDQDSMWTLYSKLGEHNLIYEGSPFTELMVRKLFKRFGEDTLDIILHKPYRLTRVRGIGFKIADGIAQKASGFEPTSIERLHGAIYHTMDYAREQGHACYDFGDVIEYAGTLLYEGCSRVDHNTYDDLLEERLRDLVRQDRLMQLDESIYTIDMWDTETYIVKRLIEEAGGSTNLPTSEAVELVRQVSDQIEEAIGIPLDEAQQRAVATVLQSRISIITGGPGTGKCFAPGTPIRMMDGSVKLVEDIVDGDQVMGWDFTPRNVWGLDHGVSEELYEITLPLAEDEQITFVVTPNHELVFKRLYDPAEQLTQAARFYTMTAADYYGHASEGGVGISVVTQKGSYWTTGKGFKSKSRLVNTQIHKVAGGEYYGFETDGDHMFLLESGVVVHNTTIIKAVVAASRILNQYLSLCAPSGKASRRLSDAAGMPASTIHRMLEANAPTEEGADASGFGRNEEHPLFTDRVVIDEATMADLKIFEATLKALPKGTNLLLVGDIDQLPSVGPCALFRDLINSKRFPVARLEKVYRQREGSAIALAAACIRQGTIPDWDLLRDGGIIDDELTFTVVPDALELPKVLIQKAAELIQDGIPPEEVQIIVPQKRGKAGAPLISYYFQQHLGRWAWEGSRWVFVGEGVQIGTRVVPPELAYPRAGTHVPESQLRKCIPREVVIGPGDRVRHTINNKELDVYNGDIGIVEQVDATEKMLSVRYPFQTNPVVYPSTYIHQLDLAYAITVHVSQGSEYQGVVLGVHETYYSLLQRNLLYTGVSRAKTKLRVCGTKRAVAIAVRNQEVAKRQTLLAKRLAP